VLAPVVAIGYGTENRTNITGAVSSVSASEIANQPVAGIDAALQGKAPGVEVMQNSGDPGNGISVRVRGAASISASNQPLYVVDGVPVQTSDFAQLAPSGQGLTGVTGLDPNDIESITVLKDASSAAIYGSRASNGVVLITTKRGIAGPARFSIDAYLGWQNAERKLDLMNGEQYVQYMNEGAVNDDEDLPFPTDQQYANTNWQDAIFRTAPVGNAHLSVSGGSDRLRYYLDGSYFGQQGIVLGSKYARANGRVNVDYNANARLTLKSSFAISHENTDRVEGDNSDNGIVTNAIGLPAIYPVMIGSRFSNPDDGLDYTNPVAIGQYDDLPTTTDRFIGNIDADYNLSSHVSLTGRLGADVLHMREDQWQSPLVVGTYAFGAAGVAKSAADNGNRYLMESFLTYQGGSDTASAWNIVGGASVEYNKDESNFIRGEGFSSADLHYIDNATNIVSYGGTGPVQHNLVSYFARANYSWKDRYLLSGSMRADGSSRFGPDNRYGYFPALSAGWL
ncbi:MAG: SusC/RagA family TonB-linked outer membrane protein, partial [Gemmatimonadaceae bacterium]